MNPPANVLLLCGEDGLGDTVRPRLEFADADLERIVAVEGVRMEDGDGCRFLDLRHDLHRLDMRLGELDDVRLVIVDPLNAYVPGDVNTHKDNEVRAVLHPICELADRHKLGVLAVMHVAKAQHERAVFRVLGSVAYTATARAVWLVAQDQDTPEDRLLVCPKMNIARHAPALRFRIVEPGCIEWSEEPVEISADEAFAAVPPEEAGPKVAEAVDWLQDVLSRGAQRAIDVKRLAREECIAERTLWRAKKKLGVEAEQFGLPPKHVSFWSLPDAPGTGPELRGTRI